MRENLGSHHASFPEKTQWVSLAIYSFLFIYFKTLMVSYDKLEHSSRLSDRRLRYSSLSWSAIPSISDCKDGVRFVSRP